MSTNGRRGKQEMEYELLDTGIFDEDRYFDVIVEYAKDGPEDVLVRITVHNRGPEAARLRVLPTLWFRNTWSWDIGAAKPAIDLREHRLVARHRAQHGCRCADRGRAHRLLAAGRPRWQQDRTDSAARSGE